MIRVTVFNEFYHEQVYEDIRKVYPEGIHGCIKNFLEKEGDFQIRTCTFDDKEHGLTEEVLSSTDVLIFWSHAKQEEFSDEVAERIQKHVLSGMGFIPLHSAHFSKPVKLLLGTSMSLKWMNGDSERLFCTKPSHQIAQGVPELIELPSEEMYGEHFDIPEPDDVIFTGWFKSGYVFRSGCTFTRGFGKIFYFQPGHEEYPVYFDKNIQKVIINALKWAYNPERHANPAQCIEVHKKS